MLSDYKVVIGIILVHVVIYAIYRIISWKFIKLRPKGEFGLYLILMPVFMLNIRSSSGALEIFTAVITVVGVFIFSAYAGKNLHADKVTTR